MSKVVFEFPTKEAAQSWLATYHNSGEQEMYEGFLAVDEKWVEPIITEEE